MDLWQILLDVLHTEGLAIFLVVGGALVLVWVIRWYMNTVYPDEKMRADREVEVDHETALSLQQMAAANAALAAVLERLCGQRVD